MTKSIPQIFAEFKKATNEKERVEVLRKNGSIPLYQTLALAMAPQVVLLVKDVPEYQPTAESETMGYNNLPGVLKKFYLFLSGHPRRPANLSDRKMNDLLIQAFESVDSADAKVLEGIIKRDLGVPYLTPKLVEKAFPGFFQTNELDKLRL